MSVLSVQFSSGLLKRGLMKERTELQSVSFSLLSSESHLSVDFSVFTVCLCLTLTLFFSCVLHMLLHARANRVKAFIAVHCLHLRMKNFCLVGFVPIIFLHWSSPTWILPLLQLNPCVNCFSSLRLPSVNDYRKKFKLHSKLVVNRSLSTVLCLYPILLLTLLKVSLFLKPLLYRTCSALPTDRSPPPLPIKYDCTTPRYGCLSFSEFEM